MRALCGAIASIAGYGDYFHATVNTQLKGPRDLKGGSLVVTILA